MEYLMAGQANGLTDSRARELIKRELSDSLRGLANAHLRIRNELLSETDTIGAELLAFRHHALRWHCLTVVNMLSGRVGEAAHAWEWGSDEREQMRHSVAIDT
jgi:hypothetical protein